MFEDIHHLVAIGGSDPVFAFYSREKADLSKEFWSIERLVRGDPLKIRGVNTSGSSFGFMCSSRKALGFRDTWVQEGFLFSKTLSTPLLSESFPSPIGEIRSFQGNRALDKDGLLVMVLAPGEQEKIEKSYLLR
jgi:hypothetical protein